MGGQWMGWIDGLMGALCILLVELSPTRVSGWLIYLFKRDT